MTRHAKGTFDVDLTPQPGAGEPGSPVIGRLALDKRFAGDLQATSKGQMLAVQTGVEGSAGYIAMEVVTGSLAGRKGTFVLQHSGTMTRGAPSLVVTVVPDSGTGELRGLEGSLSIDIVDGQHHYSLVYSLPKEESN